MSHLFDTSKKFELSPKLRLDLRQALVLAMVSSIQRDHDNAKHVVTNGFAGVNNLNDKQLIEDYADWHELEDEGDYLHDSLMCRIIEEQGIDAFEREILGKEKI